MIMHEQVSNFDSTSWKQAVLPVVSGGLGFRLTADISVPAYSASLNSTLGLVQRILPSTLHSGLNARI